MAAALSTERNSDREGSALSRKFDFDQDRFSFPNELHWEYRFDAATKKMSFAQRDPKPDYAHHCFVLVRTARQFLYHARFDPSQSVVDDAKYRHLIRKVVSRNPRKQCEPGRVIVIPGFANLREFSKERESLLKAECGGARQSYVLRSHWRMIFPISRNHQQATANEMAAALEQCICPIIHLVTFPKFKMNHGMILFHVKKLENGMEFLAYDPNDPEKPTPLAYDSATRTFSLSANRYWAGGNLNIIEIYRNWFM